MLPVKFSKLPHLSDFDRSLIRKISQLYDQAGELSGTEPIIWQEFGISPPEELSVLPDPMDRLTTHRNLVLKGAGQFSEDENGGL